MYVCIIIITIIIIFINIIAFINNININVAVIHNHFYIIITIIITKTGKTHQIIQLLSIEDRLVTLQNTLLNHHHCPHLQRHPVWCGVEHVRAAVWGEVMVCSKKGLPVLRYVLHCVAQ